MPDEQANRFTPEEVAAMKQRATELRAEGRKGATKADRLQALLDRIAAMAPEDRALAERVHVVVTTQAPQLHPKTWYGIPAYANDDGKVVVFFQDAGKFNYRYATWGFQRPRPSTTATCGRFPTRWSRGHGPWRSGSSNW